MDVSEAKKKDQLPTCPVETTLTLIGDKWKVLILRAETGSPALTVALDRRAISYDDIAVYLSLIHI